MPSRLDVLFFVLKLGRGRCTVQARPLLPVKHQVTAGLVVLPQ